MEFNFKTKAIWKPADVVGLDIGSNAIKVVQLKKQRKLTRLVGYGKVDVPENCVIDGVISDPEKMAVLLSDFFNNPPWGKITARRANMSLSESRVFTRIVTLPHTDEKSREESVLWEVSQLVPMAVSDLYIDWQLIGPNPEDPKKDDIIFAAAPKSIVNSYLQLASILDLELIGMEINISAVARAVVPKKKANEAVLIVDLGHDNSSAGILDKFLRVTASMQVGGEKLSNRIVEVKKREAEKDIASTDNVKTLEIINEEMIAIVKELDRMIHYYYEKINKKGQISQILLCGGTASLPGLAEYFTETLDISTVVGNPWSNISVYPIKPVSKAEASLYTNAIGLALVGVQDE